MAKHIAIEIGGLADLDLAGLRQRWLELYETEAPVRMSREVLVQAIAYRLQERAFGGLSPKVKGLLSGGCDSKRPPRTRIARRIRPGTRFLRQWQGRTVEAVADASGGFTHQGRTYASLSAIAREVTGTRWSGPAFFGLGAEHRP